MGTAYSVPRRSYPFGKRTPLRRRRGQSGQSPFFRPFRSASNTSSPLKANSKAHAAAPGPDRAAFVRPAIRPSHRQRKDRRRRRRPLVLRRRRDQGRHHRRHRPLRSQNRRPHHRRQGHGGRARVYRHPHPLPARHFHRSLGAELHPAGRNDIDGRKRRQFANAHRQVSSRRGESASRPEFRHLRRPGIHSQRRDAAGESPRDARRNRKNARADAAGDARRRVRHVHRPFLRARQLYAAR